MSPPPTAAIARAIRESSPPDAVSATGANGSPAFGRTRKTASSPPVDPGLVPLTQLADELAVPHPDAAKLGGDRIGERRRGRVSLRAQLEGQRVDARLGLCEHARGDFSRIGSVLEGRKLGPRLLPPREQLLVRRAAETPLRLRDPVELGLELLEAARLGFERREKGVQIGGGLAQAELDVPQLVPRLLELGREPLERRDRPLREPDEAGGSFALLRCERRGGRGSAGGQVGDVPVPLALGAETLLLPGIHAFGVLDQRAQLDEPGLGERGVRRQLVVPPPRALQVAPRVPSGHATGELLLAAEAVEHLELIGRPREPPLLELARHREHALDRGGDVLPGSRSSPRVGAGASVGEDAPGDDECVVVLRTQLVQLLEVLWKVELRLDVCLLAGGADERVVALGAEEEAQRLGEDRLAGARLPRDRVQAGRELELGLADEDEVLDAQPAEHAVDRRRAARRCPLAVPVSVAR